MNTRHHDDGSLGSKVYAGCLYSCLTVYTLVFLFGRYILPPQEQWCPYSNTTYLNHYKNPDYNYHPCHKYRTPYLLYLHLQEVHFGQRMILSVILGGIIGFERRASERPAGIRTMSMVCLGSCFFSMCGQLAFKSSTCNWDAARVAAAIPSGVGFLGAGLIWKGSTTTSLTNSDGELLTSTSQSVHGLTTAASVWLAAAVGVAVSGGRRLYLVSFYGVSLVILVLRFGPSMYFTKDSDSMKDFDDDVDSEIDWESVTDSSQDQSQYDDNDEDNNVEYQHFKNMSTYLDAYEHTRHTTTEHEQGYSKQSTSLEQTRRTSSTLSRHASAPNIMMMHQTYEVPIIDHDKRKEKRISRRDKGTNNNNITLSFHG